MNVAVRPSRLDRVVVFDNGALVTRTVPLAPGVARIAVEGLPLRFVDDSLRVRPASGAVRVGMVEERCRIHVTSTPPPSPAAVLEAQMRVADLSQRRRTLEVLRALDAVEVELPPTDVPTSLSVTSLLAAAAAVEDRAVKLAALERELEADEQEATRALAEARRLAQLDRAPPRILRGVELDVDGGEDGGSLELEYFVGAARWVPSYSLHLLRSDRQTRARLVLGALVAQASGEDWHDVALSVSTSPLSRSCTLPLLSSWRLGRAQPLVHKGFRPLPSDLPSLFAGWDRFPVTTAGPIDASAGGPSAAAVVLDAVDRAADTAPDADDEGGAHGGADGALSPPGSSAKPPLARSRVEATSLSAKRRSTLPGSLPPPAHSPPRMSMAAPPLGASPELDDLEETAAAFAHVSTGEVPNLRARGAWFGGGAPQEAVVSPEPPPPLRTTGLRMAFADEGERRGQLWPMDVRERLAWLLEVADVEGVDGVDRAAEVGRALRALEEAERRLAERSLPRGTSAVTGARARVYGGGRRATIASDGFEHRVEVHHEEGAASIEHRAVPRESLDVFRVCRFTPTGALPSGPVQIYEQDTFVVTSVVTGSGGATMTFHLGVDPDVKIEARTPHVQQLEKGLMGTTSVIEHRVVTEVRSTRSEPVKLVVFDRVPVPADEQTAKDLQVTLGQSAPPVERTDRGPDGELLEGGLNVKVTLMPGDAMKLVHSYTLNLPAKLDVVGGTRRE
jgi:hypothetical protein